MQVPPRSLNGVSLGKPGGATRIDQGVDRANRQLHGAGVVAHRAGEDKRRKRLVSIRNAGSPPDKELCRVEICRSAAERDLDALQFGRSYAASNLSRHDPRSEIVTSALRSPEDRGRKRQWSVIRKRRAVDWRLVAFGAGAAAVPQIGQWQRSGPRYEHVVGYDGLAAGGAHAGCEPRVADREVAGREQEQVPFRRVAIAIVHHAADYRPGAVVDATGKCVGSADTVAVAGQDRLCAWDNRGGDCKVRPVAPDRLLRFLCELCKDVGVIADETGAPAVRAVGLADLAHDIEPGLEAELMAAIALGRQYARKSGVEKLLCRCWWQAADRLALVGAGCKARSGRACPFDNPGSVHLVPCSNKGALDQACTSCTAELLQHGP